MPKVKARKNEPFERTLRRFIHKVNKSGVLSETRLRDRHISASKIKQQKLEAKQRKIRLEQRRRRR
ncbi:30S ribosomal protein S21 [candidate division WWE3 bacterium]|nr:30S ribosomal protein S21 [candidate division WWE3 bacterium]